MASEAAAVSMQDLEERVKVGVSEGQLTVSIKKDGITVSFPMDEVIYKVALQIHNHTGATMDVCMMYATTLHTKQRVDHLEGRVDRNDKQIQFLVGTVQHMSFIHVIQEEANRLIRARDYKMTQLVCPENCDSRVFCDAVAAIIQRDKTTKDSVRASKPPKASPSASGGGKATQQPILCQNVFGLDGTNTTLGICRFGAKCRFAHKRS